jgi:serine protease
MRALTAWLLLGLAVTTPAGASVATAPAAAPPAPPSTAPSAAAQGQATPAAGLIVRLKQPLPHAMDAVPGAPERSTGAANPSREHLRWQRVLLRAGLAGDGPRPAPARRAAGRDLQWLDFGRVLPARDVQALAARLAQQPEVDWVAPNTRERLLQAGTAEPFVLPNDPLFAQQWWLQPAGGSDGSAPAQRLRGVPGFQRAWASGLPGATGTLPPGVVIAVLDTGITPHPELQGRLLPGYDFISDAASANDGDGRDPDPADPGDWVDADDLAQPRFADCTVARSSWHGTLIAGLLAARTGNAQGVAAIHPAARILPVRVAGKCGASVVDIIDGMRWAAGLPVPGVPLNPHPARIINISFGGPAACGLAYQATLQELDAAGVVVVAASGNGFGAVSRPANCAGVVGVVALNRDGFKTHYANFGPELAGRGLATVGGDDAAGGAWGALLADGGLVSIWNDGERAPGQPAYAALYGTSFAAPLVSGTLSLMLAVNPALTAAQLRQGLLQSARPHVLAPALPACSDQSPGRCACTTASCGVGILDADMALRYAVAPVTWVAPPRAAATVDTAELRSALALGPDRPPNPAQTTPPGGGVDDVRRVSSGGGAAAPAWALALLGAVVALWRTPRAPAAGGGPLSARARRSRRLTPLSPLLTRRTPPPQPHKA